MKLRINGFEVEGEPEELSEFVKEYTSRKKAEEASTTCTEPPVPSQKAGSKSKTARVDKIYDRIYKHEGNEGTTHYHRASRTKRKEMQQKAIQVCHLISDGMKRYDATIKVFGYQGSTIYEYIRKAARKVGLPKEAIANRAKSKKYELGGIDAPMMPKEKRMYYAHREDNPKIDEAVNYVRQGFGVSSAMKKVFGYSTSDYMQIIRRKCFEQGIPIIYRGKVRGPPQKKMTASDEPKKDGRALRWAFMHNRTKSLMYDNKMRYEQAMAQARQEWKLAGNKQKVDLKKASQNVPRLIHNKGLNKVLLDIIKNAIANKGRITYANEGAAVGIDTTYYWNEVLRIISGKVAELSDYFGVPVKCVIERYGSTCCLRFE